MNGTGKNLLSMLLYSIKLNSRRDCHRRKYANELMSVGHCLNHNVTRMVQCFKKMSDNLALIQYSPINIKMPQLCW